MPFLSQSRCQFAKTLPVLWLCPEIARDHRQARSVSAVMIIWLAGDEPIFIAMRNILIITSPLFLAQAKPCRAEYGWPPLPYAVTPWWDSHGRHARRLC